MRLALIGFLVLASFTLAHAGDKTIVFVDGTSLRVQDYAVDGGVIQFTDVEGQLRSIPKTYVNLGATERANGGVSAPPPAPSPPPAPAPPRDQTPTRPVAEPARPEPEPEPLPTEPIAPEPTIPDPSPEPTPSPVEAAGSTAEGDLVTAPPPMWSNDELQVSLQVPSADWTLQDEPPSFDVAVAMRNENSEGRATLALIRKKIRGRRDFSRVVDQVEQSIASSPGFRPVSSGEVMLDPYQAHEFEFVKSAAEGELYSRLVVVYSRDLAYVLSLTCPEGRRAENERDFDALTRGLVIRKSRKELSF